MSLTATRKIQAVLKRVHDVDSVDMNPFGHMITGRTSEGVICKGREMKMLASYNYLGLANHPQIIEVANLANQKFGTGASGPRHSAGTSQMHCELEKKIAKFKRKESAIVYCGGFITNQTSISALMEDGDLILVDSYCHQSIISGCEMSEAEWMRFKHNDLWDLGTRLKINKPKFKRILVVFEGIYSMDGDIAPAPEIVEIAKRYGAFTMVDEAHSLGVLGENGRGIDEYFGLEPDDIDIYMGTLSKAIPSVGGYIAGTKDLTTFLRYGSNGYIFSCANTPGSMAVAIKALEIMEREKNLHRTLKKRIEQFITGCKKIGFDTLMSQDSAVIPINIGDETTAVVFAKMMFDAGIFINPIVYPAVPKGMNRLRCCIIANHSEEDIDFFLITLEKIAKELKIPLERKQ